MEPRELEAYFDKVLRVLETSYIAHEEPWRQSGQSGPEDRWTLLRKPVAECIDRSGTFLDIGCANGYLLECCLHWTSERGIEIVPYGVDLSARLVELARKRLPRYADKFFVGNALTWTPPQQFDFVRTELVYVPAEYEQEYVRRLLAEFVKPGGRLLVANYGEGDDDPARGIFPENYPTRHILERLEDLGFTATGYCDGYEPVKGRRTRVAILRPEYSQP